MFVFLDTNVVSELIRKAPDSAVKRWTTAQSLENLYFSMIEEAELYFGAAILLLGRCRKILLSNIENMLSKSFRGRILSFNSDVAQAFAEIAAAHHLAEISVATANCQIAEIERS